MSRLARVLWAGNGSSSCSRAPDKSSGLGAARGRSLKLRRPAARTIPRSGEAGLAYTGTSGAARRARMRTLRGPLELVWPRLHDRLRGRQRSVLEIGDRPVSEE